MVCITGAHEPYMYTSNQRSKLYDYRWVCAHYLQMHDSNGVPILALPPVSVLYGIEKLHV